MKNFTSPIQQNNNYARLENNKTIIVEAMLTEFEDKTDSVGFIQQDPDEYSFLVIDSKTSKDKIKATKRVSMSLEIRLKAKKVLMER